MNCPPLPHSILCSAMRSGGGVTPLSLALDAHGKSLSSALMGPEVEAPVAT